MPHGRGQVQWIELGFDADGRITGMHCRVLGDAGAYAGFGGALAMGPTRMMAQGVYRIPPIRYDVAVAVTNTTPMGAFRGAGRPEAAEFLERMMDLAGRRPCTSTRSSCAGATCCRPSPSRSGPSWARSTTPATIRRPSTRPSAWPATTTCGPSTARRASGDRWQLGIGVAVYVEITAGGGSQEYGSVEVHRDGTATIRVGTSAHGQGHATAFAMIVSDRLGHPAGGHPLRPVGHGCGPARGRDRRVPLAADRRAAPWSRATEEVLARAKELAAAHLEASVDDIVVSGDGRLGVAGVPSRALSWAELAALAEDAEIQAGDADLVGGLEDGEAPDSRDRPGEAAADRDGHPGDDGSLGPLAAAVDFSQDGATFPFGAHVSVVEVDMETGEVGRSVMSRSTTAGASSIPLLVTGQQHGGIAQGMAQALWEQVVFDDDGNPAHGQPGRLRHAERRGVPLLRDGQHRDADAPGTRSAPRASVSRDHRLDAVGPQRGGRCPVPSRRQPRRHAVHPGAGLAGDRGGGCRRGGREAGPCGGTLRRSSTGCPAPGAREEPEAAAADI